MGKAPNLTAHRKIYNDRTNQEKQKAGAPPSVKGKVRNQDPNPGKLGLPKPASEKKSAESKRQEAGDKGYRIE
jgi:hypothetical protein